MSSQSFESLLPRHEAFLRCEPVDRPLLGAWVGGYYPADQFPRGHGGWNVGQSLQPTEVRFAAFRDDYEQLHRVHRDADDDFFYVGSPYWGIPWLEAILGCAIHVGETSCWAEPWFFEPRELSRLRFDLQENAWFQCLMRFTEDLLRFARGRFPVCPPLLRGPGDAAAAICGSQNLVLALVEREAWAGGLLNHCAQVRLETSKLRVAEFARIRGVGEGGAQPATARILGNSATSARNAQLRRLETLQRLQGVVPAWFGTHAAGGYPSKLWTARTVSYYQDDVASLLNPRLFGDVLLPLARTTKPAADVHFIHLHSSCLYMEETLLADDTFSVIEVNLDLPGSGPPLREYLPALQRVQRAGRPLLLWGEISPEDWTLLENGLRPAGLSIQPIVRSPDEILRYRWCGRGKPA